MMIEVRDNPGQSCFQIVVDGAVAGFSRYVRKAGRVIFVHTEIDPAFEGRGLGSTLAREALDNVGARGLTVVPLCPFIEGFIERHPEYRDLVDAEALAALESEG